MTRLRVAREGPEREAVFKFTVQGPNTEIPERYVRVFLCGTYLDAWVRGFQRRFRVLAQL
jgi:hypothetical protein